MREIRHVIDGESAPSSDGRTFASVNPWTREEWATVALAGRAEVDAAISAARKAFDEGPWPRMSPKERGEVLHRVADAIDENCDEIAALDTSDMGKPISLMRTIDAPNAARNFRFFADHARLATAETYPLDEDHHLYSRFEPAGVIAAIAPWNFPVMLGAWKVAPALAWGNTVVMKPAEQSPASATRLAQLALEAGMPPGVFNVVHGFGPDSTGEFLTTSDRIDRITFTGESRTGGIITAAAAPNLVPVAVEGGGKGANVVFADVADLDVAVRNSARSIFTNSGQVCLASSRVFVERPVYEDFVDRLAAIADGLVVGDPMDEATQIGPLSSEEQHEKVLSYLDTIPEDGGKVVTGGAGDGWVVRPTVVVGLPADARACQNEIFGPVVVVTPFDGEDEALEMANNTRYGLSAMVHTENVRRAHRFAHGLNAGTVWVNCTSIRDPRTPFGGFGISGIGREGGDFSREFFTEAKTIVMEI